MAEKCKSLGTDEDVYQFLEVRADGEATLLAVFILRLPRNKRHVGAVLRFTSSPGGELFR